MIAVLAFLPAAAWAQEPRTLAQYSHHRIEAPGTVVSVAQGPEGFLWIASSEGLFRYDGSRFERIAPGNRTLGHELPGVLLVTRSGEIWAHFASSGRFGVYRDGALQIVEAPDRLADVRQMLQGPDGAIWMLTANFDAELLRFHEGRWRTFGAAEGLPRSNARNILVGADGALWISTRTSVARLPPGAGGFEVVVEGSDAWLSQDPEGRMWITDALGSRAITGPDGRGHMRQARRLAGTGESVRRAPLFDRDGNLWIATSYHGLRYISSNASPPQEAAVVASFTEREGLSSGVVHQILQDREGNIWTATEGGLDLFRPATLMREPALDRPGRFGDKLLAAADGSVYIGQARTIYRVPPGGKPMPLLRDMMEPQSLCEAPDGALWIGLESTIVVWADGAIRRTIARPDADVMHNIIYDCAFDAHGGFWISASGGGVHRYAQGQWASMLDPGSVADGFPTTMVPSPHGGIVVQAGERLHWMEGTSPGSRALDFGQGRPAVLTLHATGDAVFAAGVFGLSRFRDGRVETAFNPAPSQMSRISGVSVTADGDVWLALPTSLVRLGPVELEHAFATGKMPASLAAAGRGYELPVRPHSHSQRTIVQGGDGRIWIATQTGTVWIDPARTVPDAVPPGVAITSLEVDGRVFRDPSPRMGLPASAAKITIDFSVLRFSEPGRVRVRYMLEGVDHDWQDPGAGRQASYSNLPSGTYRFRVTAENSDDARNGAGDVLEFDIPATFFESIWFPVLVAAAGLALLWLLYGLRVARISHDIRSRLEERIRERERIARELHDTLLQGVQGLILRFQAAAEQLPAQAPVRGQLEAALAVADEVVIDARNQVQDLRVDDGSGNLCALVGKLVATTPFDPPIAVRIVVEGNSRPLNPMVSAEIVRIVREALLNIARHANSPRARIAIGFEASHLAVRVRDYGVGIPHAVLACGEKTGHFGMIGMRERAQRIGGSLTINGGEGDGAEVILVLPARLAFFRWTPRRARFPHFRRGSSTDG